MMYRVTMEYGRQKSTLPMTFSDVDTAERAFRECHMWGRFVMKLGRAFYTRTGIYCGCLEVVESQALIETTEAPKVESEV